MLNNLRSIQKIKQDIQWVLNAPVHELDSDMMIFPEIAEINIEEKDVEKLFKQRKLGYYYEGLIAIILKNSSYNIIHQSLQIVKNGVTKGEVDFIIEDPTGKIIHLEVTCKFYLEYENEDGSVVFLGPDARDSLTKKKERLMNHQLKIDLPISVDRRCCLMQVVKFKNHIDEIKNRWAYADEINLKETLNWYYLPKLSWLSGLEGDLVECWEEEKKKILLSQKARQYAMMEKGELVNRLLLVSRSWPLNT